MRRGASVVFLMVVVIVGTAQGQEWARKMFKTTRHDFGSVARGAKAECAFEVTNCYEEAIHISGLRSTCGCTTPKVTKDLLKTWENGQIVCLLNTRSFLGYKSATITVTIDRPYFAEVQLTVTGHIRSDVVFDPGVVAFGSVDHGSEAEKKILVSYAGRNDWKIADVRSANTHFEVELGQTHRSTGRVGYELLVRLKDDTPVGYIQDQLTLITDDPRAKPIPLAVEGRVMPALTVSPASLFLGIVEPGKQVTKPLVVRGKKPFRILSMKCADECFQFKPPDGSKTLHIVQVTFVAADSPRKVVEKIEIETDLGPGAAATCVATATVKAPEGS